MIERMERPMTQTLPRRSIPATAEDRRQSIGGDLDTARAFLIAAMKGADKFETRLVHARIAVAVHDLDEALRELASP